MAVFDNGLNVTDLTKEVTLSVHLLTKRDKKMLLKSSTSHTFLEGNVTWGFVNLLELKKLSKRDQILKHTLTEQDKIIKLYFRESTELNRLVEKVSLSNH